MNKTINYDTAIDVYQKMAPAISSFKDLLGSLDNFIAETAKLTSIIAILKKSKDPTSHQFIDFFNNLNLFRESIVKSKTCLDNLVTSSDELRKKFSD